MFEKLPFPISNIVLVAGVAATLFGFINYNDPTLNLAGIFVGIPLLLGGGTMKAVELKPVPVLQKATEPVIKARAQQATEIQSQVRSDITKYSYGANAYLEDALEFLGIKGTREADLPRLSGYWEELREDRYTLVLRFTSPAVPFEKWQEGCEKKSRFFGQDVRVDLKQPEDNQVELALVSTKGLSDPA